MRTMAPGGACRPITHIYEGISEIQRLVVASALR